MWFVVPGHYGCLRAFKHKSFFVEGILKSEFMKHVHSIMSQMYRLEFGVAFTMFFIAPLTLSRYHKMTVTKTLPSRFTEKSISLNPALLECLSVWRMVTKKTQFGSFCVLNLILASFFFNSTWIPSIWRNITNPQFCIFWPYVWPALWNLCMILVQGDWNSFVSSNGGRRPEITALRIE